MMRPFNGWTGRLSLPYLSTMVLGLATTDARRMARSVFEMRTGCSNTMNVTPSVHGYVVRLPVYV